MRPAVAAATRIRTASAPKVEAPCFGRGGLTATDSPSERIGWSPPPRRRLRGALAPVLLLCAASAAAQPDGWHETFDAGRLDPARWSFTAQGDFRERTVDVLDLGREGRQDFRLRLRADTLGTRDDTVKFLGVRSAHRVRLRKEARIAVELDWNDQANGSYLSAAVVLSPHVADDNPERSPDWLKVEYIGVPPGRNARLIVAVCSGGQERQLYTEGWPDTNRQGRRIAIQHVAIRTRGRILEVWENGTLAYASAGPVLSFDEAYLYLQLSSHSNYPAREVYFDDVRFGSKP